MYTYYLLKTSKKGKMRVSILKRQPHIRIIHIK